MPVVLEPAPRTPPPGFADDYFGDTATQMPPSLHYDAVPALHTPLGPPTLPPRRYMHGRPNHRLRSTGPPDPDPAVAAPAYEEMSPSFFARRTARELTHAPLPTPKPRPGGSGEKVTATEAESPGRGPKLRPQRRPISTCQLAKAQPHSATWKSPGRNRSFPERRGGAGPSAQPDPKAAPPDRAPPTTTSAAPATSAELVHRGINRGQAESLVRSAAARAASSAFLVRVATKSVDPGAAVVTVIARPESDLKEPVQHCYIRTVALPDTPTNRRLLESRLARKAIEFVRKHLRPVGGLPAACFVMVTPDGLRVVNPEGQQPPRKTARLATAETTPATTLPVDHGWF